MIRVDYSPVTPDEQARMRPIYDRVSGHFSAWPIFTNQLKAALPLHKRSEWSADPYLRHEAGMFVIKLTLIYAFYEREWYESRTPKTPASRLLLSIVERDGPPREGRVTLWTDEVAAALYAYLDEHADLVTEVRACLPGRVRLDTFQYDDGKGGLVERCLDDELLEAEAWIRKQYRLLRDEDLHLTSAEPSEDAPAGYVVKTPAERAVDELFL